MHRACQACDQAWNNLLNRLVLQLATRSQDVSWFIFTKGTRKLRLKFIAGFFKFCSQAVTSASFRSRVEDSRSSFQKLSYKIKTWHRIEGFYDGREGPL